ncbi:MAG TPA: FAD-dependent oxidoreductase [Legionellaceae bacterium]|nr:FAD-dependent oxidoreductase [Legionellaceae bacterium]
MKHSTEFIIMGAGIIGLSAAIALCQRGYQVIVLEKQTCVPVENSNRVYALNQSSQTLLEHIGVWQHLDKKRISIYEHMHVWDAFGKAYITFDARMLARDRLGIIIEEALLKNALIQCVRDLKIPLIEHWQTEHIEEKAQGIMITDANQTSWVGSCMVIAEGASSDTRQKLNIPMTSWPYHQHAIVATVHVEKPHARTAYQIFRTEGPLAFLPLVNQQHCSIVWSSESSHIQHLMALSTLEFEKALNTAFEHTLGVTQLLSPRHSFPLRMQHVNQYVGSRWIIMGDAAHTIHPLAGLGLNLGLADLNTFLTCITQFKQPGSRALRTYQRQRKHALWQVILFLQSMHLLFTHTHLPIKILRGLGLRLCHRLPFLKRMMIEQATGVKTIDTIDM